MGWIIQLGKCGGNPQRSRRNQDLRLRFFSPPALQPRRDRERLRFAHAARFALEIQAASDFRPPNRFRVADARACARLYAHLMDIRYLNDSAPCTTKAGFEMRELPAYRDSGFRHQRLVETCLIGIS